MDQGLPIGQGDYPMDASMPFDQQIPQGNYEDEMNMPITSTEKFMDIINQTDFMLDEDDGQAGYEDCEMIGESESPYQFSFGN